MAYTPDNNPYIPGDPYSYDLKWMVEKFKHFEEPQKYVDEAAAQAEIAKANAEAAENSAESSHEKAEDAALKALEAEAAKNTIMAGIGTLSDNVTQISDELDALSARMDTFSQLAEGSTTGDAELMDARVGYNGVNWDTAGDAIRGQVSGIIDVLPNVTYNDLRFWEQGGYNITTAAKITATNRIRTSAYLSVKNLYKIKSLDDYQFMILGYDVSKSYLGIWSGSAFIPGSSNWINSVLASDLSSSAIYIRIFVRTSTNVDIDYNSSNKIEIEYYNQIQYTPLYNIGGGIAYKKIDDFNLANGAIDGSTGIPNVSSPYAYTSRYTEKYSVENADYIISHVEQDNYLNYYHSIFFYEDDNTFISREIFRDGRIAIAKIPSNAAYFAISLTQITDNNYGTANITEFEFGYGVQIGAPIKKWYVLGDSRSAGYYSMTESEVLAEGRSFDYNSPVQYEGENTGSIWNRSLDHNYWGYYNNRYLHAIMDKQAYPGQGFLRVSGGDSGMSLIKAANFSDADLITIAWGFNDWHYNLTRGSRASYTGYPDNSTDITAITDINGAIWYCLGMIAQKAPTARIIIQTPFNGWAYGGDISTNWSMNYSLSNSGTLADIVSDIIYWAEYYGLEILNLSEGVSFFGRLVLKDNMVDGSHLTDKANSQLADYIASRL